MCTSGQKVGIAPGHRERDHFIAFRQIDALHAGGRATHWANLRFLEPYRLTVARTENDLPRAIAYSCADNLIIVIQSRCDDAAAADVRVLREWCALDSATAGGRDNIALGRKISQRLKAHDIFIQVELFLDPPTTR